MKKISLSPIFWIVVGSAAIGQGLVLQDWFGVLIGLVAYVFAVIVTAFGDDLKNEVD